LEEAEFTEPGELICQLLLEEGSPEKFHVTLHSLATQGVSKKGGDKRFESFIEEVMRQIYRMRLSEGGIMERGELYSIASGFLPPDEDGEICPQHLQNLENKAILHTTLTPNSRCQYMTMPSL